MKHKLSSQVFFAAPEICPVLNAALPLDLVSGKQYHRSPGRMQLRDATGYCAQLSLKPASVATEEDYQALLAYLGEKPPCVHYWSEWFKQMKQ